MLPVDLFDPVYGIVRKWVVDGYTRHRTPAQVIDHVIYRLEFLFQIVLLRTHYPLHRAFLLLVVSLLEPL